jgi:hypothetical protein
MYSCLLVTENYFCIPQLRKKLSYSGNKKLEVKDVSVLSSDRELADIRPDVGNILVFTVQCTTNGAAFERE